MKKILFLLLSTVAMYGQVPADATPLENIQITNNKTSTTATKVNVQENDGTINTKPLSELANYLEFASAVNLPVTGEQGKLYLTKDNNKIYRWNGTFYQELASSDPTYQSVIDALTFTPENVANKATALTASSTLYPNNDAVIAGLALKEDKVNKVTSIGLSANDTNYPSELAVKTYADNLVVGMLNDRGVWDASVNVFPTTGGSGIGGAIRKGDMWYISVAGILGTKSVNVGDSFRALVNAPAQVAANWSILEANIGYVPANDADVVHLTGAETITGVKSFASLMKQGSGTFTFTVDGGHGSGPRLGLSSSPSGSYDFFEIGAFNSQNNFASKGRNFAILSTIGGVEDSRLKLIANTGNVIIQNGGTFTDDLTNRLQVAGTVSSGTTALNNTQPTANNQLTRKDYVDTGLALKANLASPALTGTPTAPTATAGTNTTQIATTAFVTNGIATADSQNVKLTGNQTISGQKSFSLTGKIDMQTNNGFPAISVTALGSNVNSAAEFINNSSSPYSTALNLQTGLSGGVGNVTLSVLNSSPTGTGIVSNASNGGVSISSQSGNGDSYISNITSGGTGRNYVGRNNGTETYSVDKTGNVLGNSYIKRSTPANNILLAGGGDLAQGTAFNKNFGTTAGTVVEGGTLGSNAYTSTSYLPLTGGALSGKTGIALSSSGVNLNNSSFFINNTSNTKGGIFGYNDVDDSFYINIIEYGVAAKTLNVDASQVNFSSSVTASPATASNHVVVKSQLDAVKPYKVYTALLTQSGTNAPTAVVLENTLGGSVIWTRNTTGVYLGTLTGVFTANKTFCTTTIGAYLSGGSNSIGLVRNSVDDVFLFTNRGIAGTDAILNNASIEIRVYD